MKQIAVLTAESCERFSPFGRDVLVAAWLLPRVLELVYTAQDLAPLMQDCGYAGPPFRWDEEHCFEVRCELDAAFFHLYLPCEANGEWCFVAEEPVIVRQLLLGHFPTPRDAAAYIMDQFPIVKEKDEKKHGRYRTKERIMEIYDAMLEARRSDRPFQTALNPAPGWPSG